MLVSSSEGRWREGLVGAILLSAAMIAGWGEKRRWRMLWWLEM